MRTPIGWTLVLTLVATGWLLGMVVGRLTRRRRETRFRLFNKPRRAPLSVLVPPGPVPRLIPGDSPNATRAVWNNGPASRQTRAGTPHSGAIDYLAAFSDPAPASAEAHVDYLLIPSDGVEE